jgi:hypothetical protein
VAGAGLWCMHSGIITNGNGDELKV